MIGHKIKMAMTDKGISNKQLANALNVSVQTVYKYRIADDLRWSTIVRICDAIGIEPIDLLQY
jgi:DNA-binding Xre family transcriptional regulator